MLRYTLTVPAGSSVRIRLRLAHGDRAPDLAEDFASVLRLRAEEADAFYAEVADRDLSVAGAAALRVAAGTLLWSKQFYHYDVARWLDGTQPSHRRPTPAAMAGTPNGATLKHRTS